MAGPEIKLEKKVDAKLDTTEKANLEKLTAEDFKNQLQKLKDEKFDLSAKNKGVRLEDIVKNYDTSTGTIDINGEKIAVGKGTDLAAWIQVLLVADGKSILSQKAKEKGIKRGIDGDIGQKTTGAIDDYKVQNIKTEAKPAKEKLPENVLDDLVMKEYIVSKNFYNITTNELGKADADSFKNYKIIGPNGKLLNAYGINNKLTINYTSPQSKSIQKIIIDYKNITATDGGVDNTKLVNNIKDNIATNENNLKLNTGKESVSDGVEDVKVSSFSPFMQEYIKSQGRYTNGEIDFNSRMGYSGMTVSNGKLQIAFQLPGNKFEFKDYNLTDIQVNNKFDQNKFIAALTNTITPRAQKWKGEQLATRYNNIQGIKINSLGTTYTIDNYIKTYENIKKDIDTYSQNGVVLDKKIVDNIPAKIEELRNQKKYIIAKNRIDADIKSFEKRNNEEMSRSEMITLGKEIEARVASLTKGDLYLTTTKVNVKDAFVKVGKTTDYDKYFARYKNLL